MCFLPNVIGGKYPTQTVPVTCPMWALCSAPQLLPARVSQPRGVALKWRCTQWAHRELSSRRPLSAGSRVQGKFPGLVLKDAKRYQRWGWVERLQRADFGGRKEHRYRPHKLNLSSSLAGQESLELIFMNSFGIKPSPSWLSHCTQSPWASSSSPCLPLLGSKHLLADKPQISILSTCSLRARWTFLPECPAELWVE